MPLSVASTSVGPIRTTNVKKTRHTSSQLLASPSYRSRSSGRPEFTQTDLETIENAIGLYLRDICTKKPWPEDDEKMTLMRECLSQANIKSLGAGKPWVELESEGYILRKVSMHFLLYIAIIINTIYRGLAQPAPIFEAGLKHGSRLMSPNVGTLIRLQRLSRQ